ncbi:MAG TPA: uroporphyrinogen-III C-methyltransferase [Terriglobales bacterium]|nr:uroporphyrinogen-III C-methyltransferase [Terriglobales bacterium]
MTGKVFLVGAGPGDPELLTLKALRILKSADAVLHDDLVSSEILSVVQPAAQLHNVGKRCGSRRISQAEINFLMIALASTGLTVVRLKSGDPTVFGRCGEEIEALRKANIEFEIVPGVTSAFGAAAAAQIPLTHRQFSHSLVFLTAHAADHSASLEWKRLVGGGATLVIYMPGSDYRELSARLMNAGLSPEMPCAVISGATTARQKTEVSTLHALPDVRRLPTPALVIVGEVVTLGQYSEQAQFPIANADSEFVNPSGLYDIARFAIKEQIR